VARDKNGQVIGDELKAAEGKPAPFRAYGKSKDHRDDLPRVMIRMAVRDGIAVRIWCWRGTTADSALMRQVQDEMRDWTWPGSCGRRPRVHLSGEPPPPARRRPPLFIGLRSGSAEAQAALSRQGRCQDVAESLRVKEVRIRESERCVICFHPDAAEPDAKVCARMLAQLGELIKDSDKLSATKRAEWRAVITAKPGLNRFLRVTPAVSCAPTRPRSRPRRTSTASTCSARPSPSSRPGTSPSATGSFWNSSAAGVTSSRSSTCSPSTAGRKSASGPTSSCAGSCLRLIRIAETTAGATWRKITDEVDLLTLGTLTGPAGTFLQTA